MKWLVTGGAGYIGSHVVEKFLSEKCEVVIVDSLVSGNAERVPKGIEFHKLDIRDLESIKSLLQKGKFDGLVHIAGVKSVAESIANPRKYFEINEKASQELFELAAVSDVSKIVFSSTAAVYGQISEGVAKESHPTAPISPYGQSKLNAERKLEDTKDRFGLETISLRYFNVSGSSNKIFAEIDSESLIPKSIATVVAGGQPLIYGDNYDTLDGTCIRDFIHVRDLADAHFLAGHAQISLPPCINLGSGIGFSVKQVLDSISRVTEINFEPLILRRRDGDMAKLIAEIELARELLDFSPTNNLDDMVRSIF